MSDKSSSKKSSFETVEFKSVAQQPADDTPTTVTPKVEVPSAQEPQQVEPTESTEPTESVEPAEPETTLSVTEPQNKTTARTSADGYVTAAHTTLEGSAPAFTSKQPRLSPPVRWLAILLGLALIALACVAWRDMWVTYSESTRELWTAPVFELIGTPPLPMWMVWAGVGSIVVGLLFFLISVRRGRMTHVPVGPSPAVEAGQGTTAAMWIRPVDIARLVSATARRLPGMSTAQTRTTGNTKKGLKVEVTISGDVNDPMLAQRVADSVKHSLKELGTTVDVHVEVEKKQELGNNV